MASAANRPVYGGLSRGGLLFDSSQSMRANAASLGQEQATLEEAEETEQDQGDSRRGIHNGFIEDEERAFLHRLNLDVSDLTRRVSAFEKIIRKGLPTSLRNIDTKVLENHLEIAELAKKVEDWQKKMEEKYQDLETVVNFLQENLSEQMAKLESDMNRVSRRCEILEMNMAALQENRAQLRRNLPLPTETVEVRASGRAGRPQVARSATSLATQAARSPSAIMKRR